MSFPTTSSKHHPSIHHHTILQTLFLTILYTVHIPTADPFHTPIVVTSSPRPTTSSSSSNTSPNNDHKHFIPPRNPPRRSTEEGSLPIFWKEAEINYAGANEYVRAHYGARAPSDPYFRRWRRRRRRSVDRNNENDRIDEEEEEDQQDQDQEQEEGRYDESDQILEPIYNARYGIYDPDHECLLPSSLCTNGFSLIHLPSQVTNWTDLKEIRSIYLKELKECLPKLFPDGGLRRVVFWNPMVRGEDLTMMNDDGGEEKKKEGVKTSSVAPMVHIDRDIGAYDSIDEVVAMIVNNRITIPNKSNAGTGIDTDTDTDTESPMLEKTDGYDDDDDGGDGLFPEYDWSNATAVIDDINRGHRFAILNFWRNAGTTPVDRSPLAVFDTRYSTSDPTNTGQRQAATSLPSEPLSSGPRLRPQQRAEGSFPYRAPSPIHSRWYVYPDMTTEECLVFYQYDRSDVQSSDVWHCALPNPPNCNIGAMTEPRRSFDIRAAIVFDELVPEEMDRFGEGRRKPGMDLEESGCFCEEQLEKRLRELENGSDGG